MTPEPTQSCVRCGEPFTAKRKSARYCSTRCRVSAHRANKSNAAVFQPTAIRDYRSTDPEPFDSKPYVSSNIEDAHKKWIKGRGADKTRIHGQT